MENLYAKARREYELEDNDGKYRLVYSYFGLAIYVGQCLEKTFSNMLVVDRIFKKEVRTAEEVDEIMDDIENSRKTMGNLINEVKQSYNLKPKIADKLEKLLEKRNYLVHKYFKLHCAKFFSEIGQLEMIQYFCDFIDDAMQLDKELETYYAEYKSRLGVTEEKIQQIMDEMRKQELKRAKGKSI